MSSFWDSSWSTIDPVRMMKYVDSVDMGADDFISILRENDVRSVCDAGCGCGIYALKLASNGFCVHGFDVSHHAVAIAQRMLDNAGYTADLKTASVLSTEYETNQFDCVLSRDVLDHMCKADAVTAVRELWRITKAGGIILLTLDSLDDEYCSEPHTVNTDGDYVYTAGKWLGMVFHPYTQQELQEILPADAPYETKEQHGELTVLIRKTTS